MATATMTFSSFSELKDALSTGQRIPNVELTPQLAIQIIEDHKGNRNVRTAHVQKLARAIQENWNPNPPGRLMFFRNSGRLADGQHRCKAVIAAGKSIVVDIVPDVDSMVGHDETANRTVADHLMMEGIENASIVAKVASALFRAEDESGHGGNAAVLDFYHQNKEFCEKCAAVAKALTQDIIPKNLIMTPGQAAVGRAMAIRVYQIPESVIDKFLEFSLMGVDSEEAGSGADLYRALSGRSAKALTSQRVVDMIIIAAMLYTQGKRGKIENMKKPKPQKQKTLTN